jgi:hypothetical protein
MLYFFLFMAILMAFFAVGVFVADFIFSGDFEDIEFSDDDEMG